MITLNQIKAEVAALRRRKPIERPVGIRSSSKWMGERVNADGDTTYIIEQCDSPLALRLALRDQTAAPGQNVRLLVTSLPDDQISPDIFSRLHKPRLLSLDPWVLVQQQFAAEAIDPRLTGTSWLADAAIEYLGGRPRTVSKSGVLDADTLWRELLRSMLGLDAEVPDLPALFRWSLDASNVRRLKALPTQARSDTEAWLQSRAGDAAEFVFAVVDKSDRPDSVPLAIAAGVLVDEDAPASAERALGRLEGLWFGNRRLGVEILRRAAGEAAALVLSYVQDPAERGRIFARAEQMLGEVDGSALAHLSPILPLGYTQRLGAFAEATRRFSEGSVTELSGITKAAQRVRKHDQAAVDSHALERIDMATRLARWLRQERGTPVSAVSLKDAAVEYMAVGGFVDWARTSLGRTAASRELSDAVATIRSAATREQERRAGAFGRLLTAATATLGAPADLLFVENVLDVVVTPLARATPVLLVVLDGMSAAVSRELVAKVTERDWAEVIEQDRSEPRFALATIPSETKYSRASLLAGRLATAPVDEKSAFAAHRGLMEACTAGAGPILFTKGDLTGDSLDTLVRPEIASTRRKVVAAIVNAIDDHLARADQVGVRWSLDTLDVLAALLHEARAAGRMVILVSDHGHVLENGSTARVTEGGERWRPNDGTPLASDELAIQGQRVLSPGNQLVSTWSEAVRYIAPTKRGYHGGLNPQEMIIPITMLVSAGAANPPVGWTYAPAASPAWWFEDGTTNRPGTPSQQASASATLSGMLFDKHQETAVQPAAAAGPIPSSAHVLPAWIQRLFGTEVFASQKQLVRLGYPGDDILKQLIGTLDERGGRVTQPALSQSLNYAAFRLPSLLAIARRLLNVDGYQVLAVETDSESVVLDKPLLLLQFGLEGQE